MISSSYQEPKGSFLQSPTSAHKSGALLVVSCILDVYFVVIWLFLGVSPTERMRNLKSPIRSPLPKLGSPIPTNVPGLQKLPQCTRCCNGIV